MHKRSAPAALATAVVCLAFATAATAATTGSFKATFVDIYSRAAQCGSGVGPTKYSSTETIKGESVVVNCGPATAKLRYKGKTYTFKQGTCFRYLGAFKLNLGSSLLVPAANSGGYSSMTINAVPHGQAEVGMEVRTISIYANTKFSGVAAKGTFTSVTPSEPFSGSWNCGAPIRKN